MLIQTIKLGEVELECEYTLNHANQLINFRAFRADEDDYNRGTYYLADFTESEQDIIVQTLTGS